MDQELVRFRDAAARENRGRRDVRRRFSRVLQDQAVRYWMTRRRQSAGLPAVATALGVAPWSLRRWADQSKTRARFHAVQVVPPVADRTGQGVIVILSADGPRVEGLSVDEAARLLVALR